MVKRLKVVTIANYQSVKNMAFVPIANCHRSIYTDSYLVAMGFASVYQNFIPLANQYQVTISDTVGYSSCSRELLQSVVGFNGEIFEPLQPVINYGTCISPSMASNFVANCHTSNVQEAIPVPCRYYPIPEAPPPPVHSVCQIRPPSSRLPLPMTRRRGEHPSRALPLPLLCWHDDVPTFIPDLESYIVLNTITATLGGIVIDPIDFDFKCDMNGFCWQGGINISDGEYQKIKAKLDVDVGEEPVLIVNVNGKLHAFICEDITRNRKFANYTYNLSGRSVTARLGADYAHAQGGLNGVDGGVISQDLYASQIVQMQLADTGITLDKWAVNDWLIPAGTYSVTGKTPIAVIADIAKACGGFIYSDPLEPKLSILPRWRKPAWELATATPELVVPTGAMESMSDKKRKNPRYNTVLLIGSHSANIYRNLQGLDRQAPADSNVLYTDRDCVVPQGQAILSDSGTHMDYSIEMRIADKYNIPLAMPSSIWQVSDPDPKDKSWNGVVQGVSFSVKRSNDAPVLWQTVTIDRYLDN